MGEIFIIFSIFPDICYFPQIYENKIGILENDIYIFPKIRKISEISCVLGIFNIQNTIFTIKFLLLLLQNPRFLSSFCQ